jgi:hypothetical protein
MNPELDVLKALQALGESDRDLQASPGTEAKLEVAFRRRRGFRKWRRISAWAIAACVILAMAATFTRGPRPIKAVPAQKFAETATALPAAPPFAPVPAAPKTRVRHAVQREIATEFFPLMDVPPPIGRGALIRVNLPAEAMRTVGLPVREDRLSERVQADVLLSEEGLATAIRFVKASQ